MANASRDKNNVKTIIGALNTDGKTPMPVVIDATYHGLKLSADPATDHGTVAASRDENRVPVMMGVSSADGITPVEIYVDSNGNMLAQTT